jgi:glutathione S-transferase
MMIFPLEGAAERDRMGAEKYPKLTAYIKRIHEREAYSTAMKKLEEMTGERFDLSFGAQKQ